jgi:hypothetical protein
MKRLGVYAAVAAAMIAVSGLLLSLPFDGPADHRAIAVSATVAFVVQVTAFGAVALASPSNVVAGWGVGVVVRLVVLVGYALLVVKAVGLAPVAALISLVTFFFLCTLAEPLFLRT